MVHFHKNLCQRKTSDFPIVFKTYMWGKSILKLQLIHNIALSKPDLGYVSLIKWTVISSKSIYGMLYFVQILLWWESRWCFAPPSQPLPTTGWLLCCDTVYRLHATNGASWGACLRPYWWSKCKLPYHTTWIWGSLTLYKYLSLMVVLE